MKDAHTPLLVCRALARLLAYPDAELRSDLPGLAAFLAAEGSLSAGAREALAGLVAHLAEGEPYEIEAAYVDCFDRGRSTSLLLFEHVHGDSRERGQAMVDLIATYERAGLYLAPGELPDFLPVALEFASTQPPKLARAFLGELADILNTLHGALVARRSRYCAVIAAVLELAGERVRHVPLPPEETIDESWAEPPAFDGCSAHGQASPGTPQPIHFVRKPPAAAGGQPGAAS
ncbi:MAG: nitrate reductase molybdenum cofactor assembly chaperone [Burkholderiales bacterium]|mgnify:CR=1 FL=1|nr:nitrate reductase molybdenum cofactor assembly chaperone [Burkholderiales bacterium]OJX07347.1 MAG: nitrate reductase molybdenum cofactor assembly chaperone [Burkholderiales bacterium 70-64]